MKKILLYIWQLPQNLLGLLVILFTRAKKNGNAYYLTNKYDFGVSLGDHIIFGKTDGLTFVEADNLAHEMGHHKQSLYLGWLYLIIIGLPSLSGNLFTRVWWAFSKKDFETVNKIVSYYYKQPWEAWADKLGGVSR
jgi:hypothetical protein